MEYKYHGYTFRQTNTTTETTVKRGQQYRQEIRYLYEIDELKPRGVRPFLTSIEQCKDYIKENG